MSTCPKKESEEPLIHKTLTYTPTSSAISAISGFCHLSKFNALLDVDTENGPIVQEQGSSLWLVVVFLNHSLQSSKHPTKDSKPQKKEHVQAM